MRHFRRAFTDATVSSEVTFSTNVLRPARWIKICPAHCGQLGATCGTVATTASNIPPELAPMPLVLDTKLPAGCVACAAVAPNANAEFVGAEGVAPKAKPDPGAAPEGGPKPPALAPKPPVLAPKPPVLAPLGLELAKPPAPNISPELPPKPPVLAPMPPVLAPKLPAGCVACAAVAPNANAEFARAAGAEVAPMLAPMGLELAKPPTKPNPDPVTSAEVVSKSTG